MLPKVVILGAGFGGIAAAKALCNCRADVLLIDKTNHHLFQPLLYQVATAALAPSDIAAPARALLRRGKNVKVLMAAVIGIDTKSRRVRLDDGAAVDFDFLIIGTGSVYGFFGHDRWAKHVRVLKTLEDALEIRSVLLFAFELAERCADAQKTQHLLTFVIVGGGPTGVELAGTIAELAQATLARDFRNIDARASRIILCEGGDRLLPAFTAAQSAYCLKALQSLGVQVRLGAMVSEIDGLGIRLGEEFISASTILWCAGTEATPAARWLAAAAAKNGCVTVSTDCSVPGHPEIFAIGDVANFDDGTGRPLPGLAPVAKQQGRYVGALVRARVSGDPAPLPFRYRDYGIMAIIGRSRAVARIAGLALTGFIAWLTWSLVHLMLLVDFRSRLIVYVNWAWAWFTYGRGARLLTETPARTARMNVPKDPADGIGAG